MATRSLIGKKNSNGTISAIYCHWDGYPTGVGKILTHFYTTTEKVDALLALGDISVLRDEVGEKHDFDDQKEAEKMGWTTAYHRDRGEDFRPAALYRDISRFSNTVCEYSYLFDNNKWVTLKNF